MDYLITEVGTVHKLKHIACRSGGIGKLYVEHESRVEFERDGRQLKEVLTYGYVLPVDDTHLWFACYQTIIERKANGMGKLVSNEWLMRKRTALTIADVRIASEEPQKSQGNFSLDLGMNDTMGAYQEKDG